MTKAAIIEYIRDSKGNVNYTILNQMIDGLVTDEIAKARTATERPPAAEPVKLKLPSEMKKFKKK